MRSEPAKPFIVGVIKVTHQSRALGVLLSAVSAIVFGYLTLSAAQEAIKLFDRKIVGGEPTTIEQHPWQVALNVTIEGRSYLCGGSIIADRWVLTAAHCFNPTTRAGEVKVKAGATNYLTQGAWSDVDRVVIHEAYDPKTHENDLALIKLRSPSQGRVIPLASLKQGIRVGQPLEVTGWGATSEGGDVTRVLLKASIPYVDNATCNGATAYNGTIKPGMMCAGYREGGVDSCQGDSGGPLVWRATDGPVLVGVVSWGEGCARKLRYGVYTRTANYAEWIGKVVASGGN
ncbi:serine protease [Bradyrhizobium sp.]|uniref:serine protease n=1 Tax=Bradyrhizobium sp. TaxID=376 RepID=UPI003C709B07